MSSIEVSKSPSQPDPSAVQWFWQANKKPWKSPDPNQWKWEPYSEDYCTLIEEAFSCNRDIVDLGDYEVDLKKGLQISKKDLTKIRRVKREGNNDSQNRFMIELPKPLFTDKARMTNDPILGTVQNYLNYFMKQIPEAYRIFYRITNIDLDCQKSEYEDIIQEVITCIEKGAEMREELVPMRWPGMPKKYIQEAKEIISEIELQTSNNPKMKLKDFFKVIMKIYAMDTFICYWLNELLEKEDRKEISVLTPYLVLFIHGFQVQDLTYKSQEIQSFRSTVFSLFGSRKLTLYRGSVLTQEDFKYYNPGSSKVFAWNASISTTKNRGEALKHILRLVKKSKKDAKNVLFIIEADFSSNLDCEGVIEISQWTKSLYDQEYLLAPGSVFEIVSSQFNINDKVYEIRLKLIKKFKDTQKLLTDIVHKMISNDQALLKDFAPDEMITVLKFLEGNKNVVKIIIEKCSLNPHLMELVEMVRITTNIQKEDVILKNNEIVTDSLNTLCRYFSPENLDAICRANNIIFMSDEKNLQAEKVGWITKKISLSKEAIQIFFCEGQIQRLWKMLKKEIKITSLSLSMKNTALSTSDLGLLMTSVQALTCLENMSLDFGSNENLSDETLALFEKALENFHSLQHLTLNFAQCSGITQKGLSHLKFGLLECRKLNYLSLNFTCCKEKPSKLLANIKESVIIMTNLQHLSLNFAYCEISDKDFRTLGDTLELLTRLNNLSLDFSNCNKVSDAWLNILDQKLPILIQHLSLSFNHCNQMSDQALSHLTNSLKCLKLLQGLSLSFTGCSLISDQGLYNLKASLQRATELQHLSLSFSECKQITDIGLNSLAEAFKDLLSLEHLSLNFKNCNKITGKGIISFTDAFSTLKSIKHLSLNLCLCNHVSGIGLNRLKEGVTSLISLQSLSIDLRGCAKNLDKDLKNFKATIKSLSWLKDCNIKP